MYVHKGNIQNNGNQHETLNVGSKWRGRCRIYFLPRNLYGFW